MYETSFIKDILNQVVFHPLNKKIPQSCLGYTLFFKAEKTNLFYCLFHMPPSSYCSCVKQMITEKCEVTVDPDDIRPASTLQDEVIDAELENIIGK